MGAAELRVVDTHDGEIEGAIPILLKPGEYQLRLTHWTTYRLFGRAPKLALWFSVLDQGPDFGSVVARHYNVSRLIGNPGRSGRFKAPATGALVRDYARLLALPNRFDRFDLQQLKRHVVIGKVDTVKMTATQETLAPATRYSVVRELVRLEA